MQALKALKLVKGVSGPRGGYEPTTSAYEILDTQQIDEPAEVPLRHEVTQSMSRDGGDRRSGSAGLADVETILDQWRVFTSVFVQMELPAEDCSVLPPPEAFDCNAFWSMTPDLLSPVTGGPI